VIKGNYECDAIVDARQDVCPMPLLKAKMALSKLQSGQLLAVEACDAGSWKDIPFYVEQVGHTLRHKNEKDGVYIFVIEKK